MQGKMRITTLQVLLAACAMAFVATAEAETAPVRVTEERGDIVVRTSADTLRLRACGPGVIHILASPDAAALERIPAQPWLIKTCTAAKVTLTLPQSDKPAQSDGDFNNTAIIDTGSIRVRVSLTTGSLRFSDARDTVLLQEFWLAPRQYRPITANGESLYAVSELFHPLGSDEALYGLGQHQSGVYNYRGTAVPLAQANTDVNIPMLVSTKGYGLFWNTASRAEFDNRFATEMKLSSAAAHAIDYYFIYGPEMDEIIHTYRTMTGQQPLFPKWAYGFVQSKNSYNSQAEVLKVAAGYRERHLPVDLIVQDATWSDHLGDPTFRSGAYSDVAGMLKQLHQSHLHAMVSVWAVLDTSTENYRLMKQKGLIIPGTTDYDPTNPASGDFYWKNHAGKVFEQGWDALWLDSSEPEQGMNDGRTDGVLENTRLAIGNGALYSNIYPLMHAANMYRHWRAANGDKRVMLLSRSGFAGMQREGAFIWSGDVYSTYLSLQRQLPGGLNYALSGMPYWTTDIGGYGWPNPSKDTRSPEYQKLYARWFEYGAFCPIFRAHGLRSNNENEIFSYPDIEPILVTYDRLRYRLLPYIYSTAWKVTSEDGTLMRPLVMDWRTDEKVWSIVDQFMFGQSLLVSPVTKEDEYRRSLYLPHAAAWYDFWTGEKLPAGRRIDVEAPLDCIPLHVRAGTILPLGPEIEYADEKPDGPIELRIYPGANASFDLYEDTGDGYGYEKGEHSIIPILWDEPTQSLTIGKRVGDFPGMVKTREFRVVIVRPGHGNGPNLSKETDEVLQYSGEVLHTPLRVASSSKSN